MKKKCNQCTPLQLCDTCIACRTAYVVEQSTKGLRYNEGKIPTELVPWSLNYAVAEVLGKGAKKYARRNWEKGISVETIIGCLERHLLKYKSSVHSDLDSETGLPHIFHVAANVAMIIEFMFSKPEMDDRHKLDSLKAEIIIDKDENITYSLKKK